MRNDVMFLTLSSKIDIIVAAFNYGIVAVENNQIHMQREKYRIYYGECFIKSVSSWF